jgi:hypothetical protein
MYMYSSRRCSRFNGIIFRRLGFSTFHYGLNSETPFKPMTISILFERSLDEPFVCRKKTV